MFVRQTDPVLLTAEGLQALCVSLNRPVVDIAELPASPARAAIAVHRSEAGRPTLAVALRSIDSGVVCMFTFGGEPHGSVHQAMDVGLAFAEGMGFLFDEDMLGGDAISARPETSGASEAVQRARAAEEANSHWHELIGEPRSEPSQPEPPGEVALTKFRNPAPGAETPPEGGALDPQRQAQLGRIPIVRRRRRGDSYATADFETRLVASF